MMKLEQLLARTLVGIILLIFTILILFPLGQLFTYASKAGLGIFVDRLLSPEALAAIWLTIKIGLASTAVNVVIGTAVAFVLHRVDLPFKNVIDALVDIPLAIPTVVIGFALLLLYGPAGWLGRFIDPETIQILFSFPGILLAHIFFTFPFMVRAVGTSLSGFDQNYERAAKTLGASRLQTLVYITLPGIKTGLIAGSVLTFAKSVGEFGATLMVSGNLIGRTQTGPLYIFSRFNTGDIEGASAIALILAVFSFIILFCLRWLTSDKREVIRIDTIH
ncbi:molybdate ABC transporter permease subunit [Sporomusa termitida]|nr:molybdate ABC transporter permease subunit [Sporomusa termitida]